MRRLLFSLVLVVSAGISAQAQAHPLLPNDSLFRRARRLVAEGNGIAGRALVDTLLRSAPEGSASYGEALYWRGALAETAAEAERDYRRVIVEYALSAYVDDALLAIAELEQARGDRAGALQHLQRFVREHPASTVRGTAALSAARLAFDQRETRLGCAMLMEARASAADADVELRNQIDYFNGRCPVDMQPVPVTSAAMIPQPVAPAQEAPTVTAPRPQRTDNAVATSEPHPKPEQPEKMTRITTPKAPREAVKAAVPRAGAFTIQLAAYNTLPDAERLVKKLAAGGVKTRVSGTEKPFRVRLGFYATRQAALDGVASLKARGIIGFVTTEKRDAEHATP